MNNRILVAAVVGTLTTTATAAAELDSDMAPEEIVVYAPFAVGMARDRIPARAQQADAADIGALQPLDVTDLLNRDFGAVSINHAQNNPLQPDLNYRGFTASPLLGLPQGLSVYSDGVRQNEIFGDTVNWDLLPVSAVDSMQLLAGPNPVFGLNSLGGALSLRMKNGFSYDGSAVDAWGGSFGRFGGSVQSGGNNGTWGYYGNADYFEEDGWRDHSPSDAVRLVGNVSHRTDGSTFDLHLNYANTSLTGNGASPAELLAQDRKAVFTWPDLTENEMVQVMAGGSLDLAAGWKLGGNAFYRNLDTHTFNGDGTIFEECDVGPDEFLCEEDDGELVLDQNGNPIEAETDDGELNAINNIGRRRQHSYGAMLQLSRGFELTGGRRNELLLGAAFMQGNAKFDSVMEVAQLAEDRSTTRTGIHAAEYATAVDSEVTTWSLYVSDTFDITQKLSLTLAGRYDDSRITLDDRSGENPELNGRHSFGRFNPAAGLTFRARPDLMFYASASQASRTPTAVELACADEAAPCSLPNAFLADPPLDEVVATSFEIGARGRLAGSLDWHVDLFRTTNKDDILFQTTGGATANVGFFSNAADTRRQGIEISLSQHIGPVTWKLDYALVDATYRDEFVVNSPNHPIFEDEDDFDDAARDLIVDDGQLLVPAGSSIPGVARHMVNLGLDWLASPALRLGADLNWRSGVYLRGDESNLLARTDNYAVVNLRAEYRFSERFLTYARIENVFDTNYETFGLLGEPDEVFPDFEDPRFLGAGAPRAAWVGVRLTF